MRQRSMSVVQPTSFRSAQPRPFDRESWRLVIKALHGPQVMQGRGASPLTYACARSELEHQANEGTTNFQVSGPACMRRGCLNAQHLTGSRGVTRGRQSTPLPYHHKQRTPIVATKHACEASSIEGDRLQHVAAFANAHAAFCWGRRRTRPHPPRRCRSRPARRRPARPISAG
jgi:hypothetical protein